jgi:cytochrome c peroxidase
MKSLKLISSLIFSILLFSCNKSEVVYEDISNYPNVKAAFGTKIDLDNLIDYAGQTIPTYITKDNTTLGNSITNKGATLGRVLFYDKQLSFNNSISCSSCHQQANSFGDVAVASVGANGTTARHSMRLVNTRFASEFKFFWDERASSLEMQSTMPIKNHEEMGYSGLNGDGTFSDLITKLSSIGYYKELFKFVYGTEEITESKIQSALAQFVKSIQSFDSKYDTGRSQVTSDSDAFPNFTNEENAGKNLFLTATVFDNSGNRISGGLGCAQCHKVPEFDISIISHNNGVIGTINGNGIDLTITRAPTLRNLVKPNGSLNGPMMHTGGFTTLEQVLGHYGNIIVAPGNTNLDQKLNPTGVGQQLHLTTSEINSVVAFIKTLSGSAVYTDTKWSNPFIN